MKKSNWKETFNFELSSRIAMVLLFPVFFTTMFAVGIYECFKTIYQIIVFIIKTIINIVRRK
mgnify:FL=1|tara:strand:- start:4148 stop:4333 length:186 start_codon:yes stop_codon:yes gene_type:complete